MSRDAEVDSLHRIGQVGDFTDRSEALWDGICVRARLFWDGGCHQGAYSAMVPGGFTNDRLHGAIASRRSSCEA